MEDKIKYLRPYIISEKRLFHLVLGLLLFVMTPFVSMGQGNYDSCSDALILCPQKVFSITNIGATSANYPNGEDDFNFCFVPKKTIWLLLETNENGGELNFSINNLQFTTQTGSFLSFNLLRAGFPCDGSTYVNDTCVANIQSNQVVQIPDLLPNTLYYICLSGGDVSGVASEFNMDVSISGSGVNRPIPSIGIWASNDTICEGESIFLYAHLDDCPDFEAYRWYKNGQLFAISDTNYIVTSDFQTGDVFKVENNCFISCQDTISAQTNPMVVQSFDIILSGDTIIEYGQPAYLACLSSVDSIFWTPSYLVQFPDSTYTMVLPQETTTFYAKAFLGGCSVTRSVLVEVKNDLKLFNTFSPNDDGANERWIVKGIEKYPDAEVSIYTRWGQRVFFTTNYKVSNAWDGTINGKKLEAGTYFYVIDLKDGASKPMKGAINLIR